MKPKPVAFVEAGRIVTGAYGSTAEAKNNGVFHIAGPKKMLLVVSSDGAGWEHVSVSLPDRCPTWEEMCFVKDLFWEPDEVVIQYHPAESDYVNFHPYVLHLWKPIGVDLPTPPPILVGPKRRKRH